MTGADSRRPSALVAADGQSQRQATADAHQAGIARPGGNHAVPRLRFPRCAACGEPITRKGYARTDIAAARDRGRRRRRGQEPEPLVPWTFLHGSCDDDLTNPAAYFIGAGTARTARGLLVEVLKLTGRDWADETDWRAMVATVLAESKPPPGD